MSYAERITHIRVFKEDDQWSLDGRDESDNYTGACWSYDTWDRAIAAVPDFIIALSEDYGVTIEWRHETAAMMHALIKADGSHAVVEIVKDVPQIDERGANLIEDNGDTAWFEWSDFEITHVTTGETS